MANEIKTKEYKMLDKRIIKFSVYKDYVLSECGVFNAKYKHTELNLMLEMHDKILTSTQLKDLRKFINESREPEQISLF